MVLRFIILGLLGEKPMSGYDLKTFFNKSINFFWTADLSQIYRELSRLEKNGLVKSQIELQIGRPDKKIYELTQKGIEAFLEWIKAFPDNLTPVSRNEFLARVFFSYQISDEEVIFQLKRYIHEKERELKTYSHIEEGINIKISEGKNKRENVFKLLTVKRGMYYANSEIEWAKRSIEEINKLGREDLG